MIVLFFLNIHTHSNCSYFPLILDGEVYKELRYKCFVVVKVVYLENAVFLNSLTKMVDTKVNLINSKFNIKTLLTNTWQ